MLRLLLLLLSVVASVLAAPCTPCDVLPEEQKSALSIVLAALNTNIDTECSRLVCSSSGLESWTASSSLSGTLSPAIGSLSSLTYLRFSSVISGLLPTELGQLTSLSYLNLGVWSITGAIPTEIGQLSRLTFFEILSNNDGTIPTEFGQLTSLNSLSISAFSVLGDIPTELGRLSLLRSLGLSTGITGAIPTEIGQLSSLLNLYLPASSISGPLPTQLGLLTKLTRFLLHSSSSSLDGTIPTEVGNILSMQSFSLTSSYMTGSIPTQLGQWSGLTDLELKLASADGVIPTHLGQLTMLDQLSITSNTISGTIPTQLGIGTLAYLSLIMPEIEGTLPTQMGQMTSLTFLFLNLPSITGIIPTEVGQLTLLNQIHIKEPNQLTGECWPFPAGAGTVSVGVAFKCGCNSPTPLKSCIPPQDCETPNTAAADKCIACVDGADLTNEDECEDRNGCTANGGDVAACGNVANSVCTDVGLNLRTCECSLGSTGILPQNFTDDSNTFSGECYDADGCTLNGGQIAGCGNISNTLCANNGPNNRTCQCAPGYQGIPVTTLADDDNTISGVCEDVDGCTVNGGDVKACGNIANSVNVLLVIKEFQ
eukprot:TRINITY_DN609_c0_g1_i12.p1 TRINITY_DN609_c0_g1~~TRINITY_DN609_c0_g1_i12.p1  ORF type:complete len:596 (+),score=67.80 TRINITY_DN609_c0_g1_i12:139-1926(+)